MESPRVTLTVWLPVVGTIALFLVVVIGTALLASNMLADLGGLIYLLASPVIYRFLKAITGSTETRSDVSHDRGGSGHRS